jgi:hypothetical protein
MAPVVGTPYVPPPASPIANAADGKPHYVKVEPTVDETGNKVPGEYIMVEDTDISIVPPSINF